MFRSRDDVGDVMLWDIVTQITLKYLPSSSGSFVLGQFTKTVMSTNARRISSICEEIIVETFRLPENRDFLNQLMGA